jgi:ComF family protein
MQTLSIAQLRDFALDLLYPPRCALCDTGGTFLCERCIEALPTAEGDRCDRCWLPIRANVCFNCTENPGCLTHLRSLYRYERDVRRLVHTFKFGDQSCLAPELGRLLAEGFEQHELEADVIVPVPLTGFRRRTRGYNQSLLLAKEVSKLTAVAVAESLRRSGHSVAQAGSASAEERRRNVEDVYSMSKGADVIGAHVLLVDDVATTGATLNACAAVLLEAGAASVSALTLARED